MIPRKQVFNGVEINYRHCKGCTRNHVPLHELKKLRKAEREKDEKTIL